MVAVAWRWLALLCALVVAGCLEPNVDPPPPVPEQRMISFDRDDTGDSVTVMAVESGFDWRSLAVKGTAAGTVVRALTGDGGAPTVEVVPSEFRHPVGSAREIMAGDALEFCAVDDVAGPVTYTIADMGTNTILYESAFEDIAACE